MTDLTKIDRPFGELDEVTRWALKGAYYSGKTIEYRNGYTWELSGHPGWYSQQTYRLKPKPVHQCYSLRCNVAVYRGQTPTFSEGNSGGDWACGAVTVKTVDGKPTRIVWEADQ